MSDLSRAVDAYQPFFIDRNGNWVDCLGPVTYQYENWPPRYDPGPAAEGEGPPNDQVFVSWTEPDGTYMTKTLAELLEEARRREEAA